MGLKIYSIRFLFFVVLISTSTLSSAKDSFEKNCVSCHVEMDISLRKTFMNALLVYGGEENMKAGLTYYFRSPSRGSSVMDEDFLRKSGVKLSIDISPKNLDEALDTYWEKYTVVGKLE